LRHAIIAIINDERFGDPDQNESSSGGRSRSPAEERKTAVQPWYLDLQPINAFYIGCNYHHTASVTLFFALREADIDAHVRSEEMGTPLMTRLEIRARIAFYRVALNTVTPSQETTRSCALTMRCLARGTACGFTMRRINWGGWRFPGFYS
jgi:hypothetical protein